MLKSPTSRMTTRMSEEHGDEPRKTRPYAGIKYASHSALFRAAGVRACPVPCCCVFYTHPGNRACNAVR